MENEDVRYMELDTWSGNRTVFSGKRKAAETLIKGNNVYQMNHSKLVLRLESSLVKK